MKTPVHPHGHQARGLCRRSTAGKIQDHVQRTGGTDLVAAALPANPAILTSFCGASGPQIPAEGGPDSGGNHRDWPLYLFSS